MRVSMISSISTGDAYPHYYFSVYEEKDDSIVIFCSPRKHFDCDSWDALGDAGKAYYERDCKASAKN